VFTIDLQQAGINQATVDVTLDGDSVLRGVADCQDNGYGEIDVFMDFTDGSAAEATIGLDGEMYGEGLFGEDFTAYLAKSASFKDPWKPGQLPRFSNWKAEWEKGIRTYEEFLEGTWGLVAVATTQKCAFFAKDAYNQDGVTNKDGSLMTLGFGSFIEDEDSFQVVIRNFSKEGFDQGPYDLDIEEPQFNVFAYKGGEPTEDARFEYSCRFRRGNVDQLVCVMPLRTEPGVDFGKDTMTCAAETYGIVQVFNRMEEDVDGGW